MAGRSSTRAETFRRRRLAVGLVVVCVLAGGGAFGVAKLRGTPGPGRLVYASRQGVFEHDLETGADRRLAELPDDVEIAMPSPDGRSVGYALGGGEVWLASIEGDGRLRVADRLAVPVGWSPDGRFVVGELLDDRDLVAVDPEGSRRVLMSGGYVTGSLPVWIDADRFAVITGENRFVIVDGQERGRPQTGIPLAASPDGAQLMWRKGDEVFMADVEDTAPGKPRRIFEGEASFAAASPQGFAAIATDEGLFIVEPGTRNRRIVDRPVDWVGWARSGPVVLHAHDGAAYATTVGGSEPTRITRRDADVFPVLAFAVVP